MDIDLQPEKTHEAGVETARKYIEHREGDIDALILGIQRSDGSRNAVATTRLENEDSAELFDMIADQVVYLAEKHDSHPAGVLQHLIHVMQERDDTPETSEQGV